MICGLDNKGLKLLGHLLQNAFVLLLTNNINNIINFPFREYAETKLVVFA
jgi:hypothetical protein